MTIQSKLDRLADEIYPEGRQFIDTDTATFRVRKEWAEKLRAIRAAVGGEAVDRKPQRNPAFVGEWHAKAVALGYDGVADMLDSVERGEPPQHIAAVLGATPQSAPVDGDRREFLGKLVRMEWVAWAREQPNAKPSWLLPWEQLTEPEREVDRRIGERIYQVAVIDAATPPPASQERSGEIPETMFHGAGAYAQCHYCKRYSRDPATLSDRAPACECGKEHGWSGSFSPPTPESTFTASPPSSAAESIPDFWVREDSLAAMAEDYVCDAAEQAKPVDPPKEQIAAALQAAATFGASLCVEQAQAGELQGFPFGKAMEAAHKMKLEDTEFGSEEVDALHREWDRLPLRDTYAVSLFLDKTMALLRRLAGGVTVDDAMVERALDAREQHTGTMVRDHLSRGRMHINEWNNGRSVIRAALVAALGAK